MNTLSKNAYSIAMAMILFASGIAAGPRRDSPDIQVLPPSADKMKIIEPLLDALPGRAESVVSQDRLVSLSIAIVLDGKVLFCRACGNADQKKVRPATIQTIYPIASVTKLFTATMLAQLVEEGRVCLEDAVRRFLPEYQPRSPFSWAAPTTLRQLAAHTSGLPQDAPVNFWCDFSGFVWLVTQGSTPMIWFVDKKTLLDSLDKLELVYPPDVHAHYSNLNMQVLGLALERASGRPFPEYIRDRILTPLGMNDTGFQLDPEQRSRLARGYVFTSPDAPPLDAPDYDLGCALYSGGLFSTAPDLAKFLAFALDEKPAKKPSVLSPASLRRMRTPQSVHRPGVHGAYGLGWGIVRIGDHDAIEHNGALLGYSAHVSAMPELGLGVVALSNSKNYLWRPEACKDFAREVLADLAAALGRAEKKTPFSSSEVHFEEYSGSYVLPGEIAVLSVDAIVDGLRVSLKGTDFDEVFAPVAPDELCFKTDSQRTPMLFFKRRADGQVASLTFLSHTFRRHSESTKK